MFSHGHLAASGGIFVTMATVPAIVSNPSGTCSVGFLNDGSVSCTSVCASSKWLNIITPGIGSSYEIKAETVMGSVSSGTIGSWQTISSTRTWTKAPIGICQIEVSIRSAASGTVLGTKTITLDSTP